MRKPGAHLDEDVRPRRLRPHARRRPRELPQVRQGGRAGGHLPEGAARHPPGARRRLRRRAAPTTAGPYRADLRFTDFSVEALATGSSRGARPTCWLCIDGWTDEVAKRFGADTMHEIEWAAWNDQIASRARAHEDRVPPRGHRSTTTPTSRCPRPTGPPRRSSTPGCSPPGPTSRRAHQGAARHVVPREPRVPAAVHRGVGRADRRAHRPRRHVRHPVHAVGRHGAARR